MTFYLLVIAMSQTTPEQEELGSRNDEKGQKRGERSKQMWKFIECIYLSALDGRYQSQVAETMKSRNSPFSERRHFSD